MVIMKMMIMMAFSSLARTMGEGLTIHSPPELFSFSFRSGDWLWHTISNLKTRISPQWLSKLRRPWPSVP